MIMVEKIEDWITTEEAARVTGYDVQHIRRLLREKNVEGKKWGRVWMVNQKSLLDYLTDLGRGPKSR
jgi:excisionase family DNA binding protein